MELKFATGHIYIYIHIYIYNIQARLATAGKKGVPYVAWVNAQHDKKTGNMHSQNSSWWENNSWKGDSSCGSEAWHGPDSWTGNNWDGGDSWNWQPPQPWQSFSEQQMYWQASEEPTSWQGQASTMTPTAKAMPQVKATAPWKRPLEPVAWGAQPKKIVKVEAAGHRPGSVFVSHANSNSMCR